MLKLLSKMKLRKEHVIPPNAMRSVVRVSMRRHK
jgi:hypothetical protein